VGKKFNLFGFNTGIEIGGSSGLYLFVAGVAGSIAPEAVSGDCIIRPAGGRLIFNATAGSAPSAMCILGNNVGINTVNPQGPLHVVGTSYINTLYTAIYQINPQMPVGSKNWGIGALKNWQF
jgi:hypothetical protein